MAAWPVVASNQTPMGHLSGKVTYAQAAQETGCGKLYEGCTEGYPQAHGRLSWKGTIRVRSHGTCRQCSFFPSIAVLNSING